MRAELKEAFSVLSSDELRAGGKYRGIHLDPAHHPTTVDPNDLSVESHWRVGCSDCPKQEPVLPGQDNDAIN